MTPKKESLVEVLRFAGDGRGTGPGGWFQDLTSLPVGGWGGSHLPTMGRLAALGSEAGVHTALCWGGLCLPWAPVLGSQRLRLPEQLPVLPRGRATVLQHGLLRFLRPLQSEGSPGAVGKTCVRD